MKTLYLFLFLILFSFLNKNSYSQCASSNNIYTFVHNNKTYEVIRENRNWANAASCAVQRGGILAEINNSAEQNAIFAAVGNANINNTSTVAPDGGGGAYVWIGGNDLLIEGRWVWDGNNDSISIHFWQGRANGNAVGGAYTNWGNEPDDFLGQDALALSLNGWPLGIAGEWNDVDHTNRLFYVVEYPTLVSLEERELNSQIKIYPNPAENLLNIEKELKSSLQVQIIDSKGSLIKEIRLNESVNNSQIEISELNSGIYFVRFRNNQGLQGTKEFIKK